MKLSQIVIGGAQIANNYGILGKNLSKNETIKIFNFLNKKTKKVLLDTSPCYGKSENLIKNLPHRNLHIISKIKNIPKNEKNIDKFITEFAINLQKKIKNKIYCIFLHDENDLKNLSRLRLIKKVFQKLKRKNIIKLFGYSIYNFQKYKKSIFKIKPDIIQFPYNLLDDRISEKDFSKLKKNKIKLFARSIFLQGLLLCNSRDLPKNFGKYYPLWKNYEKNLNLKKINKLQSTLNYVNQNKHIDKYIIGFKSLNELKQILTCKISKTIVRFDVKNYKMKKFLISPQLW